MIRLSDEVSKSPLRSKKGNAVHWELQHDPVMAIVVWAVKACARATRSGRLLDPSLEDTPHWHHYISSIWRGEDDA